MKLKPYQISIDVLLREVGNHLAAYLQWTDFPSVAWANNAVKYLCKAEAVLAIIEIYDCGSVGGYGIGQKAYKDNKTLWHRWNWLCIKYKLQHTPNTVGTYYDSKKLRKAFY